MSRCPHCDKEIKKTPANGLCPHCGAVIELILDAGFPDDEGATVEFSAMPTVPEIDQEVSQEQPTDSDSNIDKTVDFSAEKTVDFDSLPSLAPGAPNEGTVEFDLSDKPKEKKTEPNAADMTIDFSEADSKSISLNWVDAASKTVRQDQTIQIGQTVSGFRSSLPIKSRSLRPPEHRGLAEPGKPASTDGVAPDYELLSLLGQGGMGVVYSAKQSSIARTVAVKMLKPGDDKSGSGSQGTSDQRDKFISEAVITGELEHPNIVPIYDLGANDEGALFYSMKRVKGTPWDEVIKEKSLSENIGILTRVADAVAFAHANGVVHRDLKPENVMLGDYGEVLVMDWGLARVTDVFPSANSVYQADSLGGTPAYMSPEMARGPVEAIDQRSDIYLLGAILYEVIGGQPPHTGKDVMACLQAAAKNRIEEIDYEGELKTIALNAMQGDPDDRYQTVKEFQEAINVYLAHSESIILSENAERNLEAARSSGDYELYSKALYGFEEALTLWSENAHALDMLTRSRIEYATKAYEKEDYDLAASLLEPSDQGLEDHSLERADAAEEVETLRESITKAQATRNARLRRLRDLRRLAIGLIAIVLGLGSYSYYEISRQKAEAVTQRDIAEKQKARAEKNEAVAELNAEEAKKQEEIAIEQAKAARDAEKKEKEQKEFAQEQETLAKKNAELARKNESKAKAAKAIAEQAQENEAYAAYVARIGLAAEKIEENAFREAVALLDACPQELRHWEWGRLRYLCEMSDRVDNVGAPVDQVVYSPNGMQYASADWFGNVTVRDAKTGEMVWQQTPSQYVHSVAYSPDGRRLAAAGSDQVARIYDTASGDLILELRGHEDAILSIDYSPDGQYLSTGGYDETVRIWNAENGKALQILRGHTWWVWSTEFSPDGTLIVTTGQDGRAVVWKQSPEGFTRSSEFIGHEGPIYDAAFSPDGKLVATAGFDGVICLWYPSDTTGSDLARRIDGFVDEATHEELHGHTGPVRSVAFDPTGEYLLSGSQDNSLRLWDLDDESSQALRGHGGRVFSVAFSPNGERGLSAGHDHQIRHWALATYRESVALQTGSLRGHQDAILAAHFSNDGSQVVTASRDRSAKLWDVATTNPIQSFAEGHAFLTSSALMVDSGRTLITSAGDNTARVWDVATGTERFLLSETGRSAALAADPAGEWVVTGGSQGSCRWWDAKSGLMLQEEKHAEEVTAIAVSRDGHLTATGDHRGEIRLWKHSDSNWKLQSTLKGHSREITSLKFVADASRLVSASGDWTCGQWDVATGEELRPLVLKHPDWVGSLDLSEDGKLAVTACDDGKARVWDLASAKVVAEAEMPGAIINSVDFAPAVEKVLLTSSGNRMVGTWAYQTEAEPKMLIGPDQGAGLIWSASYGSDGRSVVTVGGNDAQLWRLDPLRTSVSFSPHGAVADAKISPDGKLVATGSWDHTAKLWNAQTGEAIRKLENGHTGFINSVTFSPDQLELMTASDDRTVRFWDVTTGELMAKKLVGHTGRVMEAVFSSDGKRILTASADKTARLWDRDTAKPILVLDGHDWSVMSCAISPDGMLAVTGSADNKARVWDLATGELIQTLSGHTASVSSVAFSPDGRRILTGGQDNLAKLWDVLTGKELLSLVGHSREVTSVGFSSDGLSVLTSGRDSKAVIWPVVDWNATE